MQKPESSSAAPSLCNPDQAIFSSEIQQLHHVSIVIPVFNERANVAPLLASVHRALEDFPYLWELILVDDGSSDGTTKALVEEGKNYGPHVRVIEFSRNFGQTAAMQAGFDYARGDIVVTLDGDLQNDPGDIPAMVERLIQEDLDLVSGWRQNRQDAFLSRKIPSRLANWLIRKITKVNLHDYGCSLKVYRASILSGIRLYGDMHRFIPAWLATRTRPERIQEHIVRHHPRSAGVSKYGIWRTFRVLFDLLSVYFFSRYSTRPGHFFGAIGLACGSVGGFMLLYLLALKIAGNSIADRPLLILAVLLVVTAVQFLTTGLLSEFLARTYFESGNMSAYVVRQAPPVGHQSWRGLDVL
jgi:glycosyltransferase involved in cell wall biosynthesis